MGSFWDFEKSPKYWEIVKWVETHRSPAYEKNFTKLFEGSCFAFGEFYNLLGQLLGTEEGYGCWLELCGVSDQEIQDGIIEEIKKNDPEFLQDKHL